MLVAGHCDMTLKFERAALGDHDIAGVMCSKALTVLRTRNPPGLWCLGDVAPPFFQVNLDTAPGSGGSATSSGAMLPFRQSSMDAASPRMSVSARVLNVVSEPRVLEPVPVLLLSAGAGDDSKGTPLPEQADVVLATHGSPHEHMVLAISSPPSAAAPADAADPVETAQPSESALLVNSTREGDAEATRSIQNGGSLGKQPDDVPRAASAPAAVSTLAAVAEAAAGTRTARADAATSPAYLLPPGWAQARTRDDRPFFVDHRRRRTQWEPPEGAIPVHTPADKTTSHDEVDEAETGTVPPEVCTI